jgi:hypothetical protein
VTKNYYPNEQAIRTDFKEEKRFSIYKIEEFENTWVISCGRMSANYFL